MFLKNFTVNNKTALVTGSGKGIGKACALALAEAGANVIILSRTEKDLLIVQDKIKKLKKKCSYYVCDVTNLKEIKKIFSEINQLDILVNNAGTNRPEYFTKIKGRIKYPQDIREIIQKIAYLVDTEALPTDFTRFRRMAERRGSLGEMSKEQAALIGAALKFIEIR